MLGLLGAATGGDAEGTAVIHYTDGTSARVPLGFGDWSGDGPPVFGNTPVARMAERNGPHGVAPLSASVYLATLPLAPGKAVASLTLPAETSGGQIHIFAISQGSADNSGISAATTPATADFDGLGGSYQQQALDAAGLGPGQGITVGGVAVHWPLAAPGQPDNTVASGQVLPVSGQGRTLVVLGAATGGQAEGLATVLYQDGSSQGVALGLCDWVLPCTATRPAFSNTLVASLPVRDTPAGPQPVRTGVFAAEVAINPGRVVVGLRLPPAVAGAQLHIFAAAVG